VGHDLIDAPSGHDIAAEEQHNHIMPWRLRFRLLAWIRLRAAGLSPDHESNTGGCRQPQEAPPLRPPPITRNAHQEPTACHGQISLCQN
jgi:hypothetical protein